MMNYCLITTCIKIDNWRRLFGLLTIKPPLVSCKYSSDKFLVIAKKPSASMDQSPTFLNCNRCLSAPRWSHGRKNLVYERMSSNCLRHFFMRCINHTVGVHLGSLVCSDFHFVFGGKGDRGYYYSLLCPT